MSGDDVPALTSALARLVPQLSRSSPPPDEAAVAEIVASPATRVLIAEDVGAPDVDAALGAMVLVVFRTPTGLRAWIEDVVVDDGARGRGVGESLNRAALDLAAELGCRTVDLTSRPSREPANRLYRRIGFVPRDTTVYRYQAESGS